MSEINIERPVVLGGPHTWRPLGPVAWDRWDGTAPSFDAALNAHDPNAIVWPIRRPADIAALAAAGAGTLAFNGPAEREVEARLRQQSGARCAMTVHSGSMGLLIAVSALMKAREIWLREGNRAQRRRKAARVKGTPEVIVPATTFHVTADVADLCGLKVVIVDVDPDTLVPTPEAIAAAITANTVGIIGVVMYAATPQLDRIGELAREHGLWFLLDDAHAPFGTYRGQPFIKWVDLLVTSFQLGKIITAGEGGALYADDPVIAAVVLLSVIGKTPKPLPAWWPTEQLEGVRIQKWNVRYNELQAAVLLTQHDVYPAQQAHRQVQYERFVEGLRDLGLPFTPLRQTGGDTLYKIGVWNRTTVPTEPLRRAFREQVTGECNAPYRSVADPESEFVPDAQSWRPALGTVQDPATTPVAVRAHQELLMLSHDFFLRHDAAEHALSALRSLAAYENELVAWAASLG